MKFHLGLDETFWNWVRVKFPLIGKLNIISDVGEPTVLDWPLPQLAKKPLPPLQTPVTRLVDESSGRPIPAGFTVP